MAQSAKLVNFSEFRRPGRLKRLAKAETHGELDRYTYQSMLDNLRARLIHSEKSYTKLSELSGVSMQTIANLVSRKTQWPWDYTVERLHLALGDPPRSKPITGGDLRILNRYIGEVKRKDRAKKARRKKKK